MRGDIANPGVNVANCSDGADWNGQNGNVTTVASAGPSSESFYGTSDQGGNVWEWNEALFGGGSRGLRGGSFSLHALAFQSSIRANLNPSNQSSFIGLRVATVPEPTTGLLAIMASGLCGC